MFSKASHGIRCLIQLTIEACPREKQPNDHVVILMEEAVHQLVSNENRRPWSDESDAWRAEIEWMVKTAWNQAVLYPSVLASCLP